MEKIKKYMNSAFEWLSRYISPSLLAVFRDWVSDKHFVIRLSD